MDEQYFSKQYNLKPLWKAILDIYGEYVKVCDKLGLKYCVDGGTMLGAVRHNGFIPWDDDFDVRMPGPDCDRFLELAQPLLPPYLKIVSWKNCDKYPMLFPKIMDTRKDVIDFVSRESGLDLPQGIYIDIFPYDGYPSSLPARVWYCLKSKCLLMVKYAIRPSSAVSWKMKIAALLGHLVKVCFPAIKTNRDYMAYCESFSRMYPYRMSDKCGWFNEGKASLHRLAVVHSWEELKMIKFEDIEVPVPTNYDSVLRSIYSDYMKLPPLEARCLFHNWGDEVPWKYGPDVK